MVSPSSKRRAVQRSVEEGWGKTAPACRAVGLNRSSFYRPSRVSPRSRQVHRAVLKLSEAHPRYGYRRITILLQRAGMLINVKRVQRLRRLEGMQVRRKQRRMRRVGPQQSERLSDATATGVELGFCGRSRRRSRNH